MRKKIVIAHRGACGYLPEHTLEGVVMAHAWGVDFIESDVVLTKDNHAIVLHDITLDTTTNVSKVYPDRSRADGKFYAIDFTLSELKELTVHERINLNTGERVFSNRFSSEAASFKVATFKEYIALIQGLNKSTGRNIGIYPELKKPEFHTQNGKDIAKEVIKILNNYGYNSYDANIYVQCFYPPTLKRLKNELGAKMKMIALLTENEDNESSADYDFYKSENGLSELATYVDGIGPNVSQVLELSGGELVKNAHNYNLLVHPYTHRSDALPKELNNNKSFFDYLYDELKIDGVFSDFGDVAMLYS